LEMWKSSMIIRMLLLSLHTVASFHSRSKITRLFSSDNKIGSTLKRYVVMDGNNDGGYKRPTINWYPGHIAKAERTLSETLRSVDVVIELRDARCPKASVHPRVEEFCGGAARVVVMNKCDLVTKTGLVAWKRSLETELILENDDQLNNEATQRMRERSSENAVEAVIWSDARHGLGVHAIKRAVVKAGTFVNEKRRRRGMQDRALRVGVIGCPNVGKSALINKILGRKRARAADKPGVTRSLQWIRVNISKNNVLGQAIAPSANTFDLLDSPGIIPAAMDSQSDALLLAACNSIGDGAYDNQGVAAYLCDWILNIHKLNKQNIACPKFLEQCQTRYKFNPLESDDLSGDDFLYKVADNTCLGDPEGAARKILQDFRNGRWGPVLLQIPPESQKDIQEFDFTYQDDHFLQYNGQYQSEGDDLMQEAQDAKSADRVEKAKDKLEETGVRLPDVDQNKEIGKGLFDGW